MVGLGELLMFQFQFAGDEFLSLESVGLKLEVQVVCDPSVTFLTWDPQISN